MSDHQVSDEEDAANVDEAGGSWSAAKVAQASYKDLGSPAQVEERFCRHLLRHSRDDLHRLLHESSMTSRDYSLSVDAFDLIRADPVLGLLLIRFPATLLPRLERAMVQAQQQYRDEQLREMQAKYGDSELALVASPELGSVKGGVGTATRVHARLVHLPPTCCKATLGTSLSADDVGKIWQVSGTVVRTGAVQMYESARTYKCSGVKSSGGRGGWRGGKGGRGGGGGGRGGGRGEGGSQNGQSNKQKCCGQTFMVHADLEQRNNALQEPETCPLMLPNGEKCPGNKFEVVENGSVHTDYQEIKIQDAATSNHHAAGTSGAGHIPRSLLIKLQHDLVDHCQPGDEVVIVGILLAQWQQPSLAEGMDCQVTMAMTAHSVRVIAEKGSSVWKSSGGSSSSGNNNSVGEMDKFRKEFSQYWSDASSVENPISARDFICKAVCPKLYGMQIVKLALLVTLIGGVSSDAYKENSQGEGSGSGSGGSKAIDDPNDNEPDAFHLIQQDERSTRTNAAAAYGEARMRKSDKHSEQVKTRRRDMSHLLLVGDPGTGKSQFLRFAAALCPRSVLTTGVGTTSAGLTCAAVREGSGKEFALEAGALVLADKGVCCIDEFGCIREADRTTIHEAMEQQTLSVAKAGIVCKLNCRATIVAVMNPKDCLYDNHASLSFNTGLGTPLLSRFDVIFKLVDSSDAERDSNVTTYLLNRAIAGAGFDVVEVNEDDAEAKDTPWSMEKLRAYISVVKERFQPAMSEEAALLLKRHYEKCRSAQSTTIPVTVRFLESLIRLSQAHARLMHREGNIVTLQDAVAVIQIMECTAFCYGGFDGVGVDDSQNVMYCDPMTIDFSPEPDLDFLCFEYRILDRYGMLNYIDDDRRRKALAVLGVETGVPGSSISWQDVTTHECNNNNSTATGNVPMGEMESAAWVAPDAGFAGMVRQQPHPSVSQDHYGRIHFESSQSQSNQNKRPRR